MRERMEKNRGGNLIHQIHIDPIQQEQNLFNPSTKTKLFLMDWIGLFLKKISELYELNGLCWSIHFLPNSYPSEPSIGLPVGRKIDFLIYLIAKSSIQKLCFISCTGCTFVSSRNVLSLRVSLGSRMRSIFLPPKLHCFKDQIPKPATYKSVLQFWLIFLSFSI